MKFKLLCLLSVLSCLGLSGCASKPVTMADVIIAEPLEIHYRKELHLARLNELLSSTQFSNEQKAQLFYERGVVYDELGLKALARYDFNQAIRLKPDLAEAYSFLGVYFTLAGNFESAYEAFDSANELNPNYQFAFFSRGIALYYGNRPKLGAKDMRQYLSFKPNDPYRMIWQYIVESKYDPQEALAHLEQNAQSSSKDEWPDAVIQLYLSRISEKEYLDRVKENIQSEQQQAERLCEAYFYLGKFMAIHGDTASATNFYRLALSTNVYDFVEHKYARLELSMNRS